MSRMKTGESEEKQMTKTQYYRKRRKKKAEKIFNILVIGMLFTFILLYVDFIRFPECYLTTWKYQLKNEIAAGDQTAITYYNTHYVKYNRSLFD